MRSRLKSRLNNAIAIVKDYGHLPPVLYGVANSECAAELAIPGQRAPVHGFQRRIRIQTESGSIDGSGNRWIAVRIGHNAPSMPIELRQQIASGFANIKPLTQETELTSRYRMITDRHRGRFRVACAPTLDQPLSDGLTTKFELLLPLK